MKVMKNLLLTMLVLILVACGGNQPSNTSSASSDSSVVTSETPNIPPHEVFDHDDIFAKNKSILSTEEFTILPKHVSNDEEVIVTDLGYFVEGESSGAAIVYRNIVNLNQVEGSVIEFEAYYNEISNFNSIEVSLIDIYDENNVVKVIFTQNPTVNTQSRVAVLVNGKQGAMNNVGSDNSFTNYAVNYRNNFRETITPDYSHTAFNFSYDVETNRIYSVIDSSSKFMLLDLQDEAVLRNSIFGGFRTNEVYVKVEFKAVDINSNAQIAITKLGNRFFNQEIENIESNLIKLNINPKYFDDNLPNGVVNIDYPLPTPIFKDYLLGNVMVEQKLFFGENFVDKTSLIKNNSFKPEQTGTYVLEYSAVDIYGNDVKRSYNIEVLSEKTAITAKFETKTYNLFEGNTLPTVTVSGGHGELTSDVKYYFNDELIENTPYLTFEEIGTLKVVVNVNDYLNQNEEFSKEYHISGKTMLTIKDGIPRALYAGSTYKVSDFEAIDYSQPKGSAGYYLEKSVYIDGVKLGENLEYTVPSNKDQILVTFYGAKDTDKEIAKSFLVDIIEITSANDASNYFISDDNLVATQTEDGVEFTATANETTLGASLPNGMVAHELGVEFLTKVPNYSYVEFILSDYFDSFKQVKIRYYKQDRNTSVRLQDANGNFTKSYTISDTFTGNKTIVFYVDNKNGYILDYYYTNIAKIEYYSDGSEFRGFESNAVFFDFSLGLARENAKFVLSRVSNQSLKSGNLVYGDTNAPQIAFLSDLPGTKVGINTVYKIPGAKAYDVLQSNSSITLSVVGPDGVNILKDVEIDKTREVTLDQYGIYRLVYTTVDAIGNLRRSQIMITVLDEVAPTIEVNGSYKDEYKVGDTVKLIDFSVSDNLDDVSLIETCIFVRDFYTYQLFMFSANEEFTFEHAGDYEIIYYAIDSSKNIARKAIEIKVR